MADMVENVEIDAEAVGHSVDGESAATAADGLWCVRLKDEGESVSCGIGELEVEVCGEVPAHGHAGGFEGRPGLVARIGQPKVVGVVDSAVGERQVDRSRARQRREDSLIE